MKPIQAHHSIIGNSCILVLLLLHACVLAPRGLAAGQAETSLGGAGTPRSLAVSDWNGIRAAHDAWQHEVRRVEGGWQAANPTQQWTTKFDGRGFVAKPQGAAWTWGLELRSYGVGSSRVSLQGGADVRTAGHRLSYHWDDTVQEWFVNDRRGLEHGFSVQRRPEGPESAPLSFELATRGPLSAAVTPDARGVEYRDENGRTVLTYTGLRVWDADGRDLNAKFTPGPGGVELQVDAAGARYPITIDPIAQQAVLQSPRPQEGGRFGAAVAILDDVAVVGAPGQDSGGLVHIFRRSLGSAGQLVWNLEETLSAPISQSEAEFGASLDISKVGTADNPGEEEYQLVVGAPFHDVDGEFDEFGGQFPPTSDAGAAYLFVYGFSQPGLSVSKSWFAKGSPFFGTRDGETLGLSVALTSDRLVLGAPGVGEVQVYSKNSAAGLFLLDETLEPDVSENVSEFGRAVDVSVSQLAVGAKSRVYVFREDGNNRVLQSPSTDDVDFGAAVAVTDDATGWEDTFFFFNEPFTSRRPGEWVVVGAPAGAGSGQAFAYEWVESWGEVSFDEFGGQIGPFLSADYQRSINLADGVAQAGFGVGASFGSSVAISGDLIAIGEPEGSAATGAAYLFEPIFSPAGPDANGIELVRTGTEVSSLPVGGLNGASFGNSIAIDGSKVLVGAPLQEDFIDNGFGEFAVTGPVGAAHVFTGGTAEIAVSEGGVSLNSGGSINYGVAVQGGEPVIKEFTVENEGSQPLTDIAVSISNAASNFTLDDASLPSTLAPGSSGTFTVTFLPGPGASGPLIANVAITSSDADESPFDIALSGLGLQPAEIEVLESNQSLVDGTGSISYGGSLLGVAVVKTFTIRNRGDVALNNLAVSKIGAHSGDYTVGALGVTSLAKNETTTFTVTFKPAEAGARTAALRIASSDADENPFDIALSGTGLRPAEIEVLESNKSLVDGTGSINFGSTGVGGLVSKDFTVKNMGDVALNNLAVSKAGTHSGDYTVGALGVTSLAAGASKTFRVTFKPGAIGARSATLRIASSDANENPFDIAVSGTGLSPTLTLGPATTSAAASASSQTFSVSSNTTWSWTDNVSWITSGEASSQVGNQSFTYTLAANTGTSSRSAVITFSGAGITRTHVVTQAGAGADRTSDTDGDGVLNAEDRYPNDAGRYVDLWKTTSLGFAAASDSPLALMWDWLAVWSINSASQLQVTWWGGRWQNFVFTRMPLADRAKGLAVDSAWNIVWYVGTDSNLYAAYVSGGAWVHAMIRPGPFARVHAVDQNYHFVWARKTNGTDVAVYWSGSAWAEAPVTTGSAVGYSSVVDPTLAQIGWKSDGGLVERYFAGSSWATRDLAGGVGAAVGDARNGYGYDPGWRNLYYGTSAGGLGWSSAATRTSGTLHAGKVWPGSPTWVSSGTHWVFARDGIGSGNKVRVFFWDGAQWQTAPIAPYANWRGDQAAANSFGGLYYVDPSNGQIKLIHY